MDPADAWSFLPVGYLLSVLVEGPVLLALLSRRHPLTRRLFAALWLTACTYPVVILVLPPLLYRQPTDRWLYLLAAETFAPAAECAFFGLAFWRDEPADGRSRVRDIVAIVLANLASFGVGELLIRGRWL